MPNNYLRPTELLELEGVSLIFQDPREIGQVFSIFNRYDKKILKGYRTRDGVRIDKQSFIDFIRIIKQMPN